MMDYMFLECSTEFTTGEQFGYPWENIASLLPPWRLKEEPEVWELSERKLPKPNRFCEILMMRRHPFYPTPTSHKTDGQ